MRQRPQAPRGASGFVDIVICRPANRLGHLARSMMPSGNGGGLLKRLVLAGLLMAIGSGAQAQDYQIFISSRQLKHYPKFMSIPDIGRDTFVFSYAGKLPKNSCLILPASALLSFTDGVDTLATLGAKMTLDAAAAYVCFDGGGHPIKPWGAFVRFTSDTSSYAATVNFSVIKGPFGITAAAWACFDGPWPYTTALDSSMRTGSVFVRRLP
jgi:hypothetical protein